MMELCNILVGIILFLMLKIKRLKRKNKWLNIQLDHALSELEECQLKLEGK